MIKPSSYILTLYRGKDEDSIEIDNDIVRRELLSSFITSLDLLSKLRELGEEPDEEEDEEDGGDDS